MIKCVLGIAHFGGCFGITLDVRIVRIQYLWQAIAILFIGVDQGLTHVACWRRCHKQSVVTRLSKCWFRGGANSKSVSRICVENVKWLRARHQLVNFMFVVLLLPDFFQIVICRILTRVSSLLDQVHRSPDRSYNNDIEFFLLHIF